MKTKNIYNFEKLVTTVRTYFPESQLAFVEDRNWTSFIAKQKNGEELLEIMTSEQTDCLVFVRINKAVFSNHSYSDEARNEATWRAMNTYIENLCYHFTHYKTYMVEYIRTKEFPNGVPARLVLSGEMNGKNYHLKIQVREKPIPFLAILFPWTAKVVRRYQGQLDI